MAYKPDGRLFAFRGEISGVELIVYPGYLFKMNYFWPSIGSGYYNFETPGGISRFRARDMDDNVVLDLNGTPDANGAYFTVQTGADYTAPNSWVIPAGDYIQLLMGTLTTKLFPNQTLHYEASFEPTGSAPAADAFILDKGIMVFTSFITSPVTWTL